MCIFIITVSVSQTSSFVASELEATGSASSEDSIAKRTLERKRRGTRSAASRFKTRGVRTRGGRGGTQGSRRSRSLSQVQSQGQRRSTTAGKKKDACDRVKDLLQERRA